MRMICSLTTEEIARATIAQRIVRAKRTLSESGLGYETPSSEEPSERLSSVLSFISCSTKDMPRRAATEASQVRRELMGEAWMANLRGHQTVAIDRDRIGLVARTAARLSIYRPAVGGVLPWEISSSRGAT
jgi:predicted RNA polymerase sigma factor